MRTLPYAFVVLFCGLLYAAHGMMTLKKERAEAQEKAPPMVDFFSRVSKLLTCANLENEVVKKCGTVPVFQAITQFQSNKQNCVNALAAVAEMNTLLEDYFGAGANCDTGVKMWQTGGFATPEACVQDVRTKQFPNFCSIPAAGTVSAPAPAPVGPAR